jgi:DNA-binding MarR family transcriptional regulator
MADEQELQQRIQAFVHAFGLLNQNRTPCGQPIPTSQAHTLQVLGQGDGIAQQALTEQLGLDKSTTSRLVAQLVDRGWVAKRINPENRREAQLLLTEQGLAALGQVQQAAAAKFQALWEQVPSDKQPQVLESLSLLTTALRERKR